jgi:hypothetical protein
MMLSLIGMITGVCGLFLNNRDVKGTDPDSQKGRSWYDGYDKGVQTTRKLYADQTPDVAKVRAQGYDVGRADGIKQGHQDGYKAGYDAGKEDGEVNARNFQFPSVSDAYINGMKTVTDVLAQNMPKTPDDVMEQARQQLLKLGCHLSSMTWVPFTGPHKGRWS